MTEREMIWLQLEATLHPINFAKYDLTNEFPEITESELAELNRLHQLEDNFDVDIDLDWLIEDPFDTDLTYFNLSEKQLKILNPILHALKVVTVEEWIENNDLDFIRGLNLDINTLEEPAKSRLMNLWTKAVLSAS